MNSSLFDLARDNINSQAAEQNLYTKLERTFAARLVECLEASLPDEADSYTFLPR